MYSQDAELRLLLGLEVLRFVEDLAVAVSEYVRGEPAVHSQHPGLEHRADDGLDEGLAGLEVLAAYGHAPIPRQPFEGGYVHSEVWGAVHEGDAFHERRVSVDHRRGDGLIVVLQAPNEVFDVLVDLGLGNGTFRWRRTRP